jgi:bile acid-coenzyme A ligase
VWSPGDEVRTVANGVLIRERAHATPEMPALTFVPLDGTPVQLTWAELDDRSTQLARLLQERGLGYDDILAIRLRNSVEHILAAFAAWKVGATPVPVRWDVPEWERDRVLSVLRPKVELDSSTAAWFEQLHTYSTDPLPEVISPRGWGICSSGSTGTPKVIVMTQPGVTIGSPMALLEAHTQVDHPQRILCMSPLYHTNGFTTLTYMLTGEQLVLMEKFQAERALDLMEELRITGFMAATTLLQRLAQVPDIDDRDLSSIQWVMQGASVLPEWLGRKWIDLVGADRMFLLYGSTELVGAAFTLGTEWLEHPGTVGRPMPGHQLRILDGDRNEVAPGEVGEIFMSSPGERKSALVGETPALPQTEDGLVSVGDMGWVDDDGYLYIADRRVDMIITGGANVFPAEVEAALNEHPDIADVVVIGLADLDWGRRVHAIVQPVRATSPPTSDEIIAWAKSRLAAYKVPKTVELIDQIPRSEATKINRSALVAERELVEGSVS